MHSHILHHEQLVEQTSENVEVPHPACFHIFVVFSLESRMKTFFSVPPQHWKGPSISEGGANTDRGRGQWPGGGARNVL